MIKRFRFITPDDILVGVVHGSGGPINTLAELQKQQRRAVEGKPLSVLEPRPGHVAVYCEYTDDGNGQATYVDLRGNVTVDDQHWTGDRLALE